MAYRYRTEPDTNDTMLVTSLDFPEVATFGESPDDAASNALDAILQAIAARMAHRQELPAPVKAEPGEEAVSLPLLVQMKVAVYNTMIARDLYKADLGRLMGWHEPQVARLFNLNHATRLADLEQVLQRLHLHPVILFQKSPEKLPGKKLPAGKGSDKISSKRKVAVTTSAS